MYIIIHEPQGKTILTDFPPQPAEDLNHSTYTLPLSPIGQSMADTSDKLNIIHGENIEEIFKKYIADKIIIEAAGGMIFNDENKLLLIFRKGMWDMPKGKLDEGESIEECALREVTEETGLFTLTIEHKLQITYHTYFIGNQLILKPSHWFKMRFTGDEKLTPQSEEDITEIKWVTEEEAMQLLPTMYASVEEMIKSYFLDDSERYYETTY